MIYDNPTSHRCGLTSRTACHFTNQIYIPGNRCNKRHWS